MLLQWIKRALVGNQSAELNAYQRGQGLALAGVNGNGGQTVRRSLNAVQPANRIIGPTLVRNDPSATGNPSATYGVNPLSPDALSQMRVGSLSNL